MSSRSSSLGVVVSCLSRAEDKAWLERYEDRYVLVRAVLMGHPFLLLFCILAILSNLGNKLLMSMLTVLTGWIRSGLTPVAPFVLMYPVSGL